MKSKCISRAFLHRHADANEWMRMCFSSGVMHKYHCRCSVIQGISLCLSQTHAHTLIEKDRMSTNYFHQAWHIHLTSPREKTTTTTTIKNKTKMLKQSQFWPADIRAANTFSMGLTGASSLYLSSFQRWVENTERFGEGVGVRGGLLTAKIRQIL